MTDDAEFFLRFDVSCRLPATQTSNAMASSSGIQVIPVPVLEDNYSYLIIDDASGTCAAVDPAEPSKVLAAAKAAGVDVSVILTTHKHWDHSGGNVEMAKAIPGLTVVGGEIDEVEGCTMFVTDGQVLTLGSLSVTCLLTPGHTKGHVSYFCQGPNEARHVFTGDVLFIGGCGKFFEGTAADMHPSLYEKLGTLPDDALVWPGHEYTVSNLAFATRATPENAAVAAKAKWATEQRESGKYTVPSRIGDEKEHNLFLRCDCAEVRAACNLPDGASVVDTLGSLRALKDSGK